MQVVEIIKKYHTSNEIIFRGHERPVSMNVEIPELVDYKYGEIPPALNKVHHDSYYKSLFNDEFRWDNVEGCPFSDPPWSYLITCDYCRTHGEKVCPAGGYYWCRKCKKQMCEWCYEETDEKIAAEHKSIHWADRREQLETCRSHNLQYRPPVLVNCDVCFKNTYTNLYINRLDAVCEKCADTDKGIELIKDKSLVLQQSLSSWWDQTELENMLNWVPLFINSDGYMILQNLNPASKRFGAVALLCEDNHGRCGFFTVYDSLDEILDEYKRTYDVIKTLRDDNKKRHRERKNARKADPTIKKGRDDDSYSEGEDSEGEDSEDSGYDSEYVSSNILYSMLSDRNIATDYG